MRDVVKVLDFQELCIAGFPNFSSVNLYKLCVMFEQVLSSREFSKNPKTFRTNLFIEIIAQEMLANIRMK